MIPDQNLTDGRFDPKRHARTDEKSPALPGLSSMAVQDSKLRPPACKGQAASRQGAVSSVKPHGYDNLAGTRLRAGVSSSQDFVTRFVTNPTARGE
jgi:hypothetical protein